MELANTTKRLRGSTKRGIVALARTASPSTWWALTLFLNSDVRCGSKPARRQCTRLNQKSQVYWDHFGWFIGVILAFICLVYWVILAGIWLVYWPKGSFLFYV